MSVVAEAKAFPVLESGRRTGERRDKAGARQGMAKTTPGSGGRRLTRVLRRGNMTGLTETRHAGGPDAALELLWIRGLPAWAR